MTKQELDKLAECFMGWCPELDSEDRQEQAVLSTLSRIVDEICTEFRHSKAMLSTLDFKRACGVLAEPKHKTPPKKIFRLGVGLCDNPEYKGVDND
jgi:hypothetical protein